VSRRLIAWLVTFPLMAAGTYLSHCYVYGYAAAGHVHHATVGAARPGMAFFCGTPFVLACLAMVGISVAARSVQALSERPRARIAAWPFGVLPVLGFVLHQWISAADTGASVSLLDPTFLVALFLQVPFGLAAYLVAKALLRLADRIGEALAPRRARLRPVPRLASPASALFVPHRLALATASRPRAPPRF
jgi:hypothetical protein